MIAKDIIKELEDNNLTVFESEYDLDNDLDLILSDKTISAFVYFCNTIRKNIVFCKFYNLDIDYYLVDEEEIRELAWETLINILETKFGKRYREYSSIPSLDDFNEYIDKYMILVESHNSSIKKLFSSLDEEELLMATVYTVYEGTYVGIDLQNSSLDDCVSTEDFEETLECTLLDLLSEYLELIEKEFRSEKEKAEEEYFANYESSCERMERLEEEKKRLNNKILPEIREFLENNPDVLREKTNGTLRHAYAKELAAEYGEKYDISIAIYNLDAIVDEVYKKIKKSK